MMTVDKVQSISELSRKVVDDFAMFIDWSEKYEYLIDLGKSLAIPDEKFKTDDNLIKGCQSKVWLHSEFRNGKVQYYADSDAIITKGLISLITGVFSGHSPEEITGANTDFIDQIGLREHLSPTRSNGLLNMIKQIKYHALAYQAKK